MDSNHQYTISIPSTVVRIGKEAFASCTSLTTLVVSSNVKSLDDGAFASSGITQITLEGIHHIGDEVFKGCTGLKVTYKLSTPPAYCMMPGNVAFDASEIHLPANYIGSEFLGIPVTDARIVLDSSIPDTESKWVYEDADGKSIYEYNAGEKTLTVSYQGSEPVGDTHWYSYGQWDVSPWRQLSIPLEAVVFTGCGEPRLDSLIRRKRVSWRRWRVVC